MFLMPSRFEPCGLNQMYSMRYGTVPIVNAVGGLADTVVDYRADAPATPKRSEGAKRSEGGTGFVLDGYTPQALLAAVKRALAVFADRGEWQALQASGMRRDFSWDRSAQEYVKIYERALAGAGG
jgi:starch synthase